MAGRLTGCDKKKIPGFDPLLLGCQLGLLCNHQVGKADSAPDLDQNNSGLILEKGIKR